MQCKLAKNVVSTRERKIRSAKLKARSVALILKNENNVTISKQAIEQISTIIHDSNFTYLGSKQNNTKKL